ncbi:MAG: hypothetical protein SNJ73_00060 [Acetobacteraceae bacterium]
MTTSTTTSAALIRQGFVTNEYLLRINGGLSVPCPADLPPPWNLPSRMFRFPIETSEHENGLHIGLLHPALADHPFVAIIEEKLGITLDREGAPNDHGYSKRDAAQWWHAVDLISSDCWQALLDTRQFTTDHDIARAVAYGLTYSHHEAKRMGHITTQEARQIMAAIDAPEPQNRRSHILTLSRPLPCKPDKGAEHWPINHPRMSGDTLAWALIHGIEDGWFAYDRSGFLYWTSAGRERYAAGDQDTFTTASGQGAFAF